MQLEPCPFCGGEAERLELTDEDNFGGSVICCKQCGASSSVHFDRKENLEDGWNRRVQAVQPVPVVKVVTDDAMRAGWNACRKSIYAVCEDVENEAERLRATAKPGTASQEQHAKGYYAGQRYAAKSIARGFNSMEAEDDDNFRSALTAIASAEPVVTTITAATIEKACTDPIEIWPTGWRETYPALASPNVGTVKARLLAALTATASAEPVAYTSQAQLDKLAKGKGGTIWSEPLPYHDDIALYAAAISGADNAE